MTIAAVSTCFFLMTSKTYMIVYIYMGCCIILVIKSAILIWALCRFKSFIKTIELFAIPNEKLMILHFINVAIYVTVQVVASVLYYIAIHSKEEGNQLKYEKVWLIFSFFLGFQGLFQAYNVIFIYALLAK